MTAQTARNPSWNRNQSNPEHVMPTRLHLVDGGATWKASQFLRQASDGLLYETRTSAASGVSKDAITHFALQDLDTALSNDTTRRLAGIVQANDLWEINELDTTVAEAASGQKAGMDVTSNLNTLDVSETTHTVFNIVTPVWRERAFQDASDDTLARAIVRVLDTTINATPAAA